MSYRTLKRILGETNFEVKALSLFGVGLSVLAVVTFGLYWWQTDSLIDEQNRTTAKLLMAPMIQQKHWEWGTRLKRTFEPAADEPSDVARDDPANDALNPFQQIFDQIEKIPSELQPENLRDFKFEMVDANPSDAVGEDRSMVPICLTPD